MNSGWGPEEAPWARRLGATQPAQGKEGSGYLDCYFCGQKSVKRSYGDQTKDNGRLELYCTSDECEVREMTVIVLRDSIQAHQRADVRVLEALDSGVHELLPVPDEIPLRTLGDVIYAPEPPLTERRTSTADVIVAARHWGSAGH